MEEEKKETGSLKGSVNYLMQRCVKNEDKKTVKNRLQGNAYFLGFGSILVLIIMLFFK